MKKLRKILSAFLAVLLLLGAMPVLSAGAVTYGDEDGFFYYITDENTITLMGYYGAEVDVVIPETLDGYPVTAITDSEWSEGIKTITLPDTIVEIQWSAFSGLDIEEITLNEGLEKIGPFAFSGCTKLESIVLPQSVWSIGEGAFEGCINLRSVNISENIIAIPDRLFKSCDFETFEITAGIQEFGNGVFSGNKNFREITVSEDNPYYCAVDGVLMDKEQTEILYYPCAKPDASYTLADTIKKIDKNAFLGCGSLDEVILPEGLEQIGEYAFSGSNIERISVPDSVTEIGERAFADCDNLEEVTLGDGIQEIKSYTFYDCYNLEKVDVSTSVKTIHNNAFAECRSLREVNLSEGLEEIGNQAFMRCTNLEFLVMPDTVEVVESEAFMECKSLINVTLSENLTIIEQNCFKNCEELRFILIPDSVTDIHWGAFDGCIDLQNVEIGSGVDYIAPLAFADCRSLTSITIPDNVVYLAQYSVGYSTYLNSHMVHEFNPCPWVIIYANKDSAAAAYAKENGLMLGVLDEEIRPYTKGDVNGDGKVTIQDATLIQKHLAGIINLEEIQQDAADLTGSPGISIGDATAIQKLVAGIPIK